MRTELVPSFKFPRIGKVIATIIALLIITAIFFAMCVVKIKPGYAGIVYNINGGIEKGILTQGWHVVVPWKKVTSYTIATEQAFLSKDAKEGSKDDESFGIPTANGKLVNVDLEFAYHFEADKLPETYSRFKGQDGKSIEQTFIRAKMKAWSSEVSATFDILDVYGAKRGELNKQVFEHVKKNFEDYGIIIDSVNFSRVGLDSETEKAVQDRVNAQQKLEQAKIEAEKAKIEAERLKNETEGKAQATLIQAEAEAKANETISKSINDTLVKYKQIDKWDGKLPQAEGGTPIIDMRSDK